MDGGHRLAIFLHRRCRRDPSRYAARSMMRRHRRRRQAADRPALVGRDHELGTLLGALDDAVAGRGRLVMIGGDPGIGKTRLADEVATVARGRGLRALWGRGSQTPARRPTGHGCRSSGLTSGRLTRRRSGASWAETAGSWTSCSPSSVGSAAGRARVRPGAVKQVPAVRRRHPPAARHGLRCCLGRRPRRSPCGGRSLDRAAAVPRSQVGDSGLLILATYRDAELTPDHPLTDGLADLARQPATRMLPLTGIADDGVAALLAAAGGRRPRPALVRSLGRLTGGNPLFVGEAIRLLGSDPSVEAVTTARLYLVIPREISETIHRRCSRWARRQSTSFASPRRSVRSRG